MFLCAEMDASYALAKNVVNINYVDIPCDAVELARKDILDTLGVGMAGSNKPGPEQLMELIREWGGKRESIVIMFGRRVPAPYAALVNSTMCHALDYDDLILTLGHAGVSIVPAAFAIAERQGRISGKDLLAAVILGVDVAGRLGEASVSASLGPGWQYTSLYGVFGAAACAGKLLALDEEQMVNAFGIAYSQAAGNFQCVLDGALTKRMQPGFASKAGVLSALMASKGLTGAKESFEGKQGLFQLYHRGEYDPARLRADLGKRFAIENLGFKPYPCCGHAHTAIDATLALAREHNIPPDDVEEISVHVSEECRTLCEPLEIKQKPRVLVDAQFSIPWTVATAFVKGKVTTDDFTTEAISSEAVLQAARKVKPVIDLGEPDQGTDPAIVEIKMKGSGVVHSARADVPRGYPQKPMSWENLADKFRDCASQGRKRLSHQKIEAVIQTIGELDGVDDVGRIMRMIG